LSRSPKDESASHRRESASDEPCPALQWRCTRREVHFHVPTLIETTMTKTLFALAALCAFAGNAAAQSNVVIFGKIDQALGKPVGSRDRQVIDTAGSRIAFRGLEDLGGGLGALFAIEHRFTPDTGASAATFWDGFSYVGLRSSTLGTLTIGRQYTSSFLSVQNNIDPFAGETVAALRTLFMGGAYGTTAGAPGAWAGAPTGLGPSKGRVADAIKYSHSLAGFGLSADIAETPVGGVDRPYSVAFNYGNGPFWAGAAYENAAGAYDRVVNLGVKYTVARVGLSAGYTDGRINTATNNELRAWLLGLNVGVGVGDIKAGYATSKVAGTVRNARLGLGYHHNLSKRTKLYVDLAHESKQLTAEKNGYDLGIQHQF
jgi:predicted porin